MRVLHILDHSIPLHSGYTFRTAALLREQRLRGWETFHLTSPKQGVCTAADEEIDGLHFFRTPLRVGWQTRSMVGGATVVMGVTVFVTSLLNAPFRDAALGMTLLWLLGASVAAQRAPSDE